MITSQFGLALPTAVSSNMCFLKQFSRKAQTIGTSKLILALTPPTYDPVFTVSRTTSSLDPCHFTFVLAHLAEIMARGNFTIKLK